MMENGGNLRSLQKPLGHIDPAVKFNPVEELNRTKLQQQQRKLATMTIMLTPPPLSESNMPPRALVREGEQSLAIGSSETYAGQLPAIAIGSNQEIEGNSDTLSGSDTNDYHRNQQYSIYALTNSAGTVSERYAYTAYGQPTFLNASATVQTGSAASNRYTYTGREWDANLRLHYFRARWMSGLTGRFLSQDPIGFAAGDANLYRYVGNKATNATDPSGLQQTPDDGIPKVDTVVPKKWPNATPRHNPNMAPENGLFGRIPRRDSWGLMAGLGKWSPDVFFSGAHVTVDQTRYGCGGVIGMRIGVEANNPMSLTRTKDSVAFGSLQDALTYLESELKGQG